MATLHEDTSLPIRLNPSQVSLLNLFFPGFTGITAATEQLLAGKLNSYAGLLFVCGVLVYFAKHVFDSLWLWVEAHLSASPSTIYDRY